jgi:hypothetical protein
MNNYKEQVFNIQGLNRLNEDGCYKKLNNKTIIKPGIYQTQNFYDPVCEAPTTMELSLKHPTLMYKDGCGWTSSNGCNIDNDSKLRNSRNLTNLKTINQLESLPHMTTPNLTNCNKNIKKESKLLLGKNTYIKRPCNTLSGITVNRFIPQIPIIKKNIQNPINLIQEVNNKNWIRGGQPSRQYIKNKDYLNKCFNN